MILYYGKINISNAPFSDIPDIHNYRQMALVAPGFDETVSRNFGYRILMPYIAGSLPFDIDTNFYILTILMSLLIPFIFFRFLQVYGLKDDTSFYLVLLFLVNRYTFGFPVWDFYDVHDLFTHILLLLFLINLKRNNFVLMSCILAIGVLNRETILFVVPAAFIYYIFYKDNRKYFSKFIISVIPSVIIFLTLRSLIVTESKASYDIFYSFGKLRFDESNKMFDPVTYYRIINTFIPLTFIPFVSLKITIEFFKKNLHFLVLIIIYYFSCFLAGDTERLIVPMFPIFFLLLGIIFEKIEFNVIKHRMMILMLCIASIPHHIFFRFLLPHRNWKVAVTLITLTAVTVYYIKLKKDNKKNVLDSNSDI
ncbi:MAG: hypothetical protein KKD38_02455 [Candidatus Delongbacteria bacterium]|nr:hypothetical protein [Candidatus Delongbacteria bacterium]